MTDLLERTPVQDVLLDERKPEPMVEPPPREERGIERPTAKRPVRWIRWMIGALVLIVAAAAVTFALSGDGTTAVLDTDGSFQANETQRMEALAPAADVLDVAGSTDTYTPLDPAEEVRKARAAMAAENVGSTDTYTPLDPAEEVRKAKEALAATDVIDLDGSYQANETRRMQSLNPDA